MNAASFGAIQQRFKISSAPNIDEGIPSEGWGAVCVAWTVLVGPERLGRLPDGVLALVLITGQLEFQYLL